MIWRGGRVRSIAPDSKSGVPARVPGVRIPPSPLAEDAGHLSTYVLARSVTYPGVRSLPRCGRALKSGSASSASAQLEITPRDKIRSPTGQDQKPHGTRSEAPRDKIRSPTGQDQKPHGTRSEAPRDKIRSPTGQDQKPHGTRSEAPRDKIRSPTGQDQKPHGTRSGTRARTARWGEARRALLVEGDGNVPLIMERCPSGRRGTTGNRVCREVPRVRIPLSPLLSFMLTVPLFEADRLYGSGRREAAELRQARKGATVGGVAGARSHLFLSRGCS